MGLDSILVTFNADSDPVTYDENSNIQSLEISNSDQDYYQIGSISFFDPDTLFEIGDTIQIYITDSEGRASTQFDGYVSSVQKSISGKRIYTYILVGRTYDLWRYVTGSDTTFSNVTTSYIASSLVKDYCLEAVNADNIDTSLGSSIVEELDFSNTTVGDALISLTDLDGYKFYVDVNGTLKYYYPSPESTTITINEDDMVETTPIEQSDDDIVNDVLVIGGTGYSAKTSVTNNTPMSSETFRSGIAIAQSFLAEGNILQGIRLYLDRSVYPSAAEALDFEIWENTSKTLFSDSFDNYSNLDIIPNSSMKILNGNLQISGQHADIEVATLAGNWQHYQQGQTFMVNQLSIPEKASIYAGKYTVDGSIWLEIRTSTTNDPDTGTPTTTVLSSGLTTTPLGSVGWMEAYLHPTPILTPGILYSLVGRHTNGWNTQFYWTFTNQITPTTYTSGARWYSAYSETDWNQDYDTIDNWFRISLISGGYSKSGVIQTPLYTSDDVQYIKIDLTGVISSNYIKISGTHDGGTTWRLLQDGYWIDFGSESANGTKLVYYFSSNGNFTPKLGEVSVQVSDSTGGMNQTVLSDTFDGGVYTYLSGTSNFNGAYNSGMVLLDDDRIKMSGITQPGVENVSIENGRKWAHPDSWSTKSGYWQSGYCGSNGPHSQPPCQWYDLEGGGYRTYSDMFSFNNPVDIDAVEWYIDMQSTAGVYLTFYISGLYTGDAASGWLKVIDNVHETVGGVFTGGWKHRGIKKIYGQATSDVGWKAQAGFVSVKVRLIEEFNPTGMIKASSQVLNSTSYNYMKLIPVNATTPDEYRTYITYSGSLDDGANWTKLEPNIVTKLDNYGGNASVWYIFRSSGTRYLGPANKSGTNSMSSPTIDATSVVVSTVQGGGNPNSGTRVLYSDEVSFLESDIPYPPSYSSWHTWTTPKLALTEGNTYWMIFQFPSGSYKYWNYYYNPNSTYDGEMKASGFRGAYTAKKIQWSSQLTLPNIVPPGNMVFDLGWSEGDVTYRQYDETSISTYGRHFKKIQDSTITTSEAAQLRAEAELMNANDVPFKGTITIDGTVNIDTDYRAALYLENIDISGTYDIVSYTQSFSKDKGFLTSVTFGAHPYDIAREVEILKGEMSI
jgi:hypothetical protein